MNARRLIILAALGLVPFLVTHASAQSIPVTVGGQASSLPGVPFELPIQADLSGRTEKLGSFSVALRWNPAVLKMTGGHAGTFGEVQVNQDSMPFGVLRISGANPAGVGGNVTLGVGVMVPLTSDTTTLKLSVLELYASQSFVDLDSVAIVGNRGYCNARGRWGDVDGDGASNSRDALVALTGAVGGSTGSFDVGLGDVDGNGVTEARDALIILSGAVGLDVRGFRILHIAPGPCATGALPHLVLDPGSDSMLVGQTISYAAHLRDVAGNDVSAPDLFWHSSNDQIASVTPAGLVIASQPGTATITAHQSGGDAASVMVTVLATRHTSWVDVLSYSRPNHTGSAQLPYATIGDAVQKTQPGDTVRIRPGRYSESIVLNGGVVLHGETIGGSGVVIAARDTSSIGTAIFANSGGVEVRNVTIDGWAIGVYANAMDTLVVDSLQFFGSSTTGCNQVGAVLAQNVSWMAVRHSRLIGGASSRCEGSIDYGLLVSGSGVVVIDGSVVTDFGSDGVSLTDTDSLLVVNSTVSQNGAYGIQVSSSYRCCTGLGITDSRLIANNYRAVDADSLRTGRIVRTFIDGRNVGDGLYLRAGGNSATLVLSNDSIVFYPGANGDAPPIFSTGVPRAPRPYCCATWLNVTGFQDLLIDGTRVDGALSGYLYSLGRLTVTNSSLTNLGVYGTAFDVSGGTVPTSVTFDSVYLAGGPGCTRCTSGLRASYARATISRFRAENLNVALQADSSMVVTNSVLADVQRGIWSSGRTAYVANNTLLNPGYDAILLGSYGSADGDTVVVTQNQVSCDAYGALNAGAIDIEGGNARVDGNTVSGCRWNIYFAGVDAGATRGAIVTNNAVSVPLVSTYAGIHFQSYHGVITGNSVIGGGPYGGIGVFGSGLLRPGTVRVENNTVRQAQTWAIHSDYVDSILVRGNLVEDFSNPYLLCCRNRAGAISVGEAESRISVQGNTLRRVHGVGITVEQYDSATAVTDTATAVIDSNAVSGADTAAVLMHSGTFVMHSNNIRGNAQYGVRAVGYPAHDADSLHGNAFQGNGLYAVSTDFDGSIQATGNWWGVHGAFPRSPGADSTSGSVNETAPLASVPTDIPPLTPRMLAYSVARPIARAPALRTSAVARPAWARVSGTTAIRQWHSRPLPAASRLPTGLPVPFRAVIEAQLRREQAREAVRVALLESRFRELASADSAWAARRGAAR